MSGAAGAGLASAPQSIFDVSFHVHDIDLSSSPWIEATSVSPFRS
ncbi:MAG: hypothetical protein ACF8XB_14315 [Planctomycetota bacterium JB042]